MADVLTGGAYQVGDRPIPTQASTSPSRIRHIKKQPRIKRWKEVITP